MLMLWLRNMQPSTVPRMAVGVVITTATGSVQDSYCAASTNIVIIIAKISVVEIVVPDCVS